MASEFGKPRRDMPENPPAGFWEELRRRKVIRVAVVYAVIAWAAVEAASVLFPSLLLPEWSLRLLVVMALIGFPVAVGLAWAFEVRPERSPEATWLIGLGLACIPLGVIEASGLRLVTPGLARELTFEWQALDLVFAGSTAALYGFGIVMAGEAAKPLRAPWLYGLAAGGEAGVARALEILRSEIERDMALLGCARLSDIGPQHIRPPPGYRQQPRTTEKESVQWHE